MTRWAASAGVEPRVLAPRAFAPGPSQSRGRRRPNGGCKGAPKAKEPNNFGSCCTVFFFLKKTTSCPTCKNIKQLSAEPTEERKAIRNPQGETICFGNGAPAWPPRTPPGDPLPGEGDVTHTAGGRAAPDARSVRAHPHRRRAAPAAGPRAV